MDTEKYFRLSLKVYATIILVTSFLHGLLHWFFKTYDEMLGLTKIQWDVLFVFNWSVTLLLLFLSILSFVISTTRTYTLNQLRAISALMIVFWIGRLVMEYIFPVQVPFIIIQSPTLFIKILIAIVITILVLPEMLLQLKINSEKQKIYR